MGPSSRPAPPRAIHGAAACGTRDAHGGGMNPTRWSKIAVCATAALAVLALADATACSSSDASSGTCPAFTRDCAAGNGPTDTDGDGCPDQCGPQTTDAAAADVATGDAAATNDDAAADTATPSAFCQADVARDVRCKPSLVCNTATVCSALEALTSPDARDAAIACWTSEACGDKAVDKCALAYLAAKTRSAGQATFAAQYCATCGGADAGAACTARVLHPDADAGSFDQTGAGAFITLQFSDAVLAQIGQQCLPIAAADAGGAKTCDELLVGCVLRRFLAPVDKVCK